MQQLAGKVTLVTGATSGIGKVTANALAAFGAHVVIVGRNQEKTQQAMADIKKETGSNELSYLLTDFADLQKVRELSGAFHARFSKLDLLVNNAGAFFTSRVLTQYGVEMSFLVNHLSPFLLTTLLLDKVKDSAPSRIINVSSEAHKYGSLSLDDLELRRSYSGMKAYARSKLANILFTYELARRVEGTGVTANALHPGHVATNIWRSNFPIVGPALKWLMGLIALSPEQGADTSIYLASSPDVSNVTGKYFVKRLPVDSSSITYDSNVAKRLWDLSEDLTTG